MLSYPGLGAARCHRKKIRQPGKSNTQHKTKTQPPFRSTVSSHHLQYFCAKTDLFRQNCSWTSNESNPTATKVAEINRVPTTKPAQRVARVVLATGHGLGSIAIFDHKVTMGVGGVGESRPLNRKNDDYAKLLIYLPLHSKHRVKHRGQHNTHKNKNITVPIVVRLFYRFFHIRPHHFIRPTNLHIQHIYCLCHASLTSCIA